MLQVYPLSEGTFTVGHDKKFVPFIPENDILEQRPTGSLLVEIQPFLVDTGKDLIILDTGLGFSNPDGTLQIHHNLRQHGYEPEDVTKVLFSHLHKDHIGGATYTDDHGLVQPTFPNALYCIYQPEASFAVEKGAPSYVPQDVEQLLGLEHILWLNGEQGDIDGYIRFTHSGGHCPQHIVFLIDYDGRKIFYGGDEAPQYKQVKTRYIAKYDYDGRKAMELRSSYAEQGRREDWELLFYHDVKTPVSKINF
ncbi:MBL fold metallo-hydrolase [Rurimicrobium arvi]|uniref:Metallo-beta-lactamase domain-containing protein n=1 Tax=Rurimicrobium arvi TaxID=2049916 RepID=A0ABP8MFS0_9BACT